MSTIEELRESTTQKQPRFLAWRVLVYARSMTQPANLMARMAANP